MPTPYRKTPLTHYHEVEYFTDIDSSELKHGDIVHARCGFSRDDFQCKGSVTYRIIDNTDRITLEQTEKPNE